MPRLDRLLRGLRTQPSYTLMRAAARFGTVRRAVTRSRRLAHLNRLRPYLDACESRMGETLFPGVDRVGIVQSLRNDGVAFGLRLPAGVVDEIVRFAAERPCFADRSTACGFDLENRAAAEAAMGKPILVAQYFNTTECPAIRRLTEDPLLQAIAADYLESVPSFVGANLWWTFPVKALESDRAEHAHLFHRDVDDFRFFKFFFYLTDVAQGEGAHVCVVGSHLRPPASGFADRWNIRRYSDAEISDNFSQGAIREICGPAGTCFAEDTLCVHKGLTPLSEPRLLLQLQFALFDYGVAHDVRPSEALSRIA